MCLESYYNAAPGTSLAPRVQKGMVLFSFVF